MIAVEKHLRPGDDVNLLSAISATRSKILETFGVEPTVLAIHPSWWQEICKLNPIGIRCKPEGKFFLQLRVIKSADVGAELFV